MIFRCELTFRRNCLTVTGLTQLRHDTVLALAQQMAIERRKQEDKTNAVFGSGVKHSDRGSRGYCTSDLERK
jgi:hypothetical protein